MAKSNIEIKLTLEERNQAVINTYFDDNHDFSELLCFSVLASSDKYDVHPVMILNTMLKAGYISEEEKDKTMELLFKNQDEHNWNMEERLDWSTDYD